MEYKAIYYGQVQLIPNVICDGYILDDGTAVMSEKGTADLLGMSRQSLNNMSVNWPPKYLESFIDADLNMSVNWVEVIAPNSHYKGRKIAVYTTAMVENLICSYALAFANGCLRESQKHIGQMSIICMKALIRTALDVAIKEACGFLPNIQKTAQKNYISIVSIIKELGFTCSVSNEIATKKDIASFLQVPEPTLTYFLHKHTKDIKAIPLSRITIKAMGIKASHLYGYHIEDVAKIAIGMDTSIGIEIKKKIFGDIASFANIAAKDEIQWQNALSRVFQGIGLQHNYQIDQYRVDFFVEKLMLVLECNGYCHKYYDPNEEAQREKVITEKYGYALVRFHHKISWQALMNGILQAKPGTVVTVYDVADIMK